MNRAVVVTGMKWTILVAMALAGAFPGSLLSAQPLKTPLAPMMAKIREALPIPDGWDCAADHQCMVISRREPVTMLNLANLPARESNKEVLEGFGKKTHYQIVLLFLPRLSLEELRELQAVQTRAIERARVHDDEKASRSALAAKKVALPMYHDHSSSIYMYRTDDGPWGAAIYPEEAAAERDAILRALDTLFEKH